MPARILKLLRIICLALVCSYPCQAQQTAGTDKVSVTLMAEASSSDINILIKMKILKGWHIYWNNPGDVGLATTVKWKPSEEYQATLINQSAPHKIYTDDMAQYGYTDTAFMQYHLTLNNPQDTQKIPVTISWLACKDECIPEKALLDIDPETLRQTPLNIWQTEISQAEKTFPSDFTGNAFYEVKNQNLLINLNIAERHAHSEIKDITFIPEQPDIIINNAKQLIGEDETHNISVKIPLENADFDQISGVLSVQTAQGTQNLNITPKKTSDLKEYPPLKTPDTDLMQIMIMAFLGGIILNFMPCIFPILSLKAIALVQGIHNRQAARTEGLLYTAGVITCFCLMATLLLWLRQQGEDIGWGFQLQSPIFVGVILGIFIIIFLMLLDIVNIQNYLTGKICRISFASSQSGAFLTGLFAVLIASPCTAPFMGIAISYTLSQPTYICYPVFMALSLGYALPFALISLFPDAVAKILPKPGAWMNTLKKLFAIPVFLTCIWLAWVLMHLLTPQQDINHEVNWLPYDEQRINELVAKRQPVFIVFTAKWCLTCLANEKLVLDRDEFITLAHKHGITLFKADWTTKNPDITQALAKYNRGSIPLYVFYGKDTNDYVILPQLLTSGIVSETINSAQKKLP